MRRVLPGKGVPPEDLPAIFFLQQADTGRMGLA
jgi:hypothetical protein